MKRVARIVSGGQSGVDRATLDFAIASGLAYGGWCPKGGWAEDFPDPPGLLARYPDLHETPESDPRQRTEWNVRDSDATLILVRRGVVSPGTAFTAAAAGGHSKPYLIVDIGGSDAARCIAAWLETNAEIRSLNIAGPRESEAPGVYDAVSNILRALSVQWTAGRPL